VCSAETIRISGTGSGLGGAKLLAAEFSRHNADVGVVVMPALGSGGGIAALIDGAIDVAVSNREPTATEIERRLGYFEYARTPWVIVARSDFPLDAITSDELARLYGTEGPRLSDGTRVRPVLRPERDADTQLLRALSPSMDAAIRRALQRPGMTFAATDVHAADAVQSVPGGLGASTLALVAAERRPLKALKLDGHVPSVAELAAGRYPYFKRLIVITRASPAPGVQRFLDFLRSPEAAAILAAHGHQVTRDSKR
jgi:phosphate transport system substrate-binding protein